MVCFKWDKTWPAGKENGNGRSIPVYIDYGGMNAKACFVNSEENRLAVAENILGSHGE